jgi:hypothetical protein
MAEAAAESLQLALIKEISAAVSDGISISYIVCNYN